VYCYALYQLTKPVPDVHVALSYLAALVFEGDVSAQQLNDVVITHGRKLLALSPDAFTALMIKFCLEDYAFIPAYTHGVAGGTGGGGSLPQPTASGSKAVSTAPVAQPNSVANIAQQQTMRNNTKHVAPISVAELLALYGADTQGGQLRMLLEGVFDGLRAKTRLIHSKITMTLVEIYLQEYSNLVDGLDKLKSSSSKAVDDIKELETAIKTLDTRIMSILDGNHVQYDASHVLLLCHSYSFAAGQQFLLEQLEATDLLVRQHIEVENDAGLFKIMRLQGRKDPELYVQILKYFVDKTIAANSQHSSESASNPSSRGRKSDTDSDSDSDEDDNERWDQIGEVLDLIEKQNVLTPTQVISVLSRNPELPFSLVAKYVLQTISDISSECSELETQTQSTQREIEVLLQSSMAKKVLAASKFVPLSQHQRSGASKRFGGIVDDDDDDIDQEEMKNVMAQEKLNTKQRFVTMQDKMKEKAKDHEKFYAVCI
jgi:hypothetical protein